KMVPRTGSHACREHRQRETDLDDKEDRRGGRHGPTVCHDGRATHWHLVRRRRARRRPARGWVLGPMPPLVEHDLYAAMSSIPIPTAIAVGEKPDHVSVELSSKRTDMTFFQTRMTADQTLMSVIRTSVALVAFGFAMYELFTRLTEQRVLTMTAAPR